MAAQLPPVAQPIALFQQFLAQQSETVVLREKVMSLSGDSFEITLASGQPLLRVQGTVMSLRGRKSVYDLANNHLFDIVREHMHIHPTFAAVDPSGKKLLEVRNKIVLFKSKAIATFTNAVTGQAESLTMRGNWLAAEADITDDKTGAAVAHISRQWGGRDILLGKQTYAVTVAPNVDLALMVALCICMDEKNNESRGG